MGIYMINKVNEVFQGKAPETDGNFSHFAVTTNAVPTDIAKAAAIQHHFDIDGSHNLFKSIALRRKGIKSKHAKKNDDDEEYSNDSDVDEVTKEESVPNDPRQRRINNVNLARMAQRNADSLNQKAFRTQN